MYKEIRLIRSDGRERIINAPRGHLKEIQRSILDHILSKEPIPDCAYGFGPGRTIVEYVAQHAKNSHVLVTDIKDFFPSVHFTRVNKIFVQMGASDLIAHSLTNLTTLHHALPQGAPTSPYLSTLSLRVFDARMVALCAENRQTYSRYFDDVAVSGTKRCFEMLEAISDIAKSEGHEIYTKPPKLRMFGPEDEKVMTGLIVRNGKIVAPQTEELRTYTQQLLTMGLAALQSSNVEKEKQILSGKIAFVQQVEPSAGKLLRTAFNKIDWQR